jgi:hypothetical protein
MTLNQEMQIAEWNIPLISRSDQLQKITCKNLAQ